ncbi:hypothetical protein [uncultured Streptomyces sp.]|uniref:hypothetical protein n=1 Tax=uncultured Streptomyces sp. TaxID=174707 RepID=UPI002620281E|nr:hypothetical protein [uncultured Streptomyces sp.]
MNDVKELLERAAAEAGRPSLTTGTVYAGVARARSRRRAGASVAVLAAVAAGAVALPHWSDGTAVRQSSVAAASVASAGAPDRAGRLEALLPAGTGRLEPVSLAVLIKHAAAEDRERTAGPLDGQYAVHRDGGGGVGYLLVSVRSAEELAGKGITAGDDPCEAVSAEPGRTGCVSEVLPDGRALATWTDTMRGGDGGTPQWGPETVGRLALENGDMLLVRASSGFTGPDAQGPLLGAAPLTGTQLRELMLRPELRPAA